MIPDLYILGKSLGGGIVPISAIVGNKDFLSLFTPGTHGSTFSGNPLACAIASATIDLMTQEDFKTRVKALGSRAIQKLKAAGLSKVLDTRGRGLFIGVDVKKELGKAKHLCELLKDKGVLCKDTRDYSIRIAPPLIISEADLDWGIDRVIEVLN